MASSDGGKRKRIASQTGGWFVNAVSLALGLIVLLYAYGQMGQGHVAWRNNYRQVIYAPSLFGLAAVFLVAGLVPWEYVARRLRSRSREVELPPNQHRRHARKF